MSSQRGARVSDLQSSATRTPSPVNPRQGAESSMRRSSAPSLLRRMIALTRRQRIGPTVTTQNQASRRNDLRGRLLRSQDRRIRPLENAGKRRRPRRTRKKKSKRTQKKR